jgi:hypothetical protein
MAGDSGRLEKEFGFIGQGQRKEEKGEASRGVAIMLTV